jgi:beta-lactam-binding protein with PASTA domain
MFRFITSKPLWVNIIVALLATVVAILFFFVSLSWITSHGKYEKVPDITGQNVYAAISTLEAKGFKVEVSDSVFTVSVPGLTITKQVPDAGAEVKSGRTIYLTVNRSVPPKIEMPSLIGFSFKSAVIYLEGMGLKLGDTTYKPDFARNAVLEQLYNKQPIKPGTQISIGSTISFVLGSGQTDSIMDMPDMVGLTLNVARAKLVLMNLSVGSVVAMGDVTDSSNAFVVKQNPAIFNEAIAGQRTVNKIRPGNTVDLYISNTPPVKDSTNTYPQK